MMAKCSMLPSDNEDKTKIATDYLLKLLKVRKVYPGAQVTMIGANTCRVTVYETVSDGIIWVNRIADTFLVDIIGDLVIRRPEPTSKRLVKWSDKWKAK